MYDLTVGDLKETLQEYLDILSGYDDNQKIRTTTNTYFINSDTFMQVGRRGFVDLGNIDDIIEDDDSDDDEETDDEQE